jgi:GntR family transcriptional regulator|nr:helix-turn-helix domain-containing protein [uncultured Lachnoclostridium sp.]
MSFFERIYKEDLPPRAKTVYMYLKDRSNKDGKCWPAVKTIAKDTSLSVSTVKRAIADLVRYGFLTKESRYRENGSYTSNQYYVL